jgi:hypothetical protein
METGSGEKERSPLGATWTVTVVAAVAVVARRSAARTNPSERATRLFLFKPAPSVFQLFILVKCRGSRSDRLGHLPFAPPARTKSSQAPLPSATLELSSCNECSDFSYFNFPLFVVLAFFGSPLRSHFWPFTFYKGNAETMLHEIVSFSRGLFCSRDSDTPVT